MAHPRVSWFRELNQQEIIGLSGRVSAGLALQLSQPAACRGKAGASGEGGIPDPAG